MEKSFGLRAENTGCVTAGKEVVTDPDAAAADMAGGFAGMVRKMGRQNEDPLKWRLQGINGVLMHTSKHRAN